MNLFRRGAHHQNGFRPTVAEIAADIKRRRSVPRVEIRDGRQYLVFNSIPIRLSESSWCRGGVLSIALPGGVTNFPTLITSPIPLGVHDA